MPDRSPIRQLLDAAAGGHPPDPDEIDACGITNTEARTALLEAALKAVRLHEIGHHGPARALARESAGNLDPYGQPAPEPSRTDTLDPDELARIVTENR